MALCHKAQRVGGVAHPTDGDLSRNALRDMVRELEYHLTSGSLPLAKVAFQRVFDSMALLGEAVGPRRRELPSCGNPATHSLLPHREHADRVKELPVAARLSQVCQHYASIQS